MWVYDNQKLYFVNLVVPTQKQKNNFKTKLTKYNLINDNNFFILLKSYLNIVFLF